MLASGFIRDRARSRAHCAARKRVRELEPLGRDAGAFGLHAAVQLALAHGVARRDRAMTARAEAVASAVRWGNCGVSKYCGGFCCSSRCRGLSMNRDAVRRCIRSDVQLTNDGLLRSSTERYWIC